MVNMTKLFLSKSRIPNTNKRSSVYLLQTCIFTIKRNPLKHIYLSPKTREIPQNAQLLLQLKTRKDNRDNILRIVQYLLSFC